MTHADETQAIASLVAAGNLPRGFKLRRTATTVEWRIGVRDMFAGSDQEWSGDPDTEWGSSIPIEREDRWEALLLHASMVYHCVRGSEPVL